MLVVGDVYEDLGSALGVLFSVDGVGCGTAAAQDAFVLRGSLAQRGPARRRLKGCRQSRQNLTVEGLQVFQRIEVVERLAAGREDCRNLESRVKLKEMGYGYEWLWREAGIKGSQALFGCVTRQLARGARSP
jgi:hypothetical protein